MSRQDKHSNKGDQTDCRRRSSRIAAACAKIWLGILSLFLVITFSGCPSSTSKKPTAGGESHFLASCSPECEEGLECICGVCTRVCDDDDDCSDLPGATCVSPELLESARECEPTDPVEMPVCDVGCSSDEECKDLGSDATCESGYCRLPEVERLSVESNSDAEVDKGKEPVPSAGSSSQPDGAVTVDASRPDTTDPYYEDPEVKERRTTLIGQYCSLIEQYPCLLWDSFFASNNISRSEPVEQQVRKCEMALEIEYHSIGGTSSCGDLWLAGMQCQVQQDYACPCSLQGCYAPSMTGSIIDLCDNEMDAFMTCHFELSEEFAQFTGKRASCEMYMQLEDPGDCDIRCFIDSGEPVTSYGAECDGRPSGPVECSCTAMGNKLSDIRGNYSVIGSDCNEAAQALADGKCIEIMDCCFTWVADTGEQQCGCTSNLISAISTPPGVEPTLITCEQLAARIAGEVVDRCPGFSGSGRSTLPPFF
jgi:hypothetical protein